jgi:hypothetical protein
MDYSDGDLLEDFASVFCDGVLLVVMPVARLHLDLPPISFPGNVIFYPNGYAELDKLNIVPNHSASNSLAELASAVSGIDEEVFARHPVVAFPFNYAWQQLRKNSHKENMALIRKLSDYVDRSCFNYIKYRQCGLFSEGDPISNIPGRAGQVDSNHMMSAALLYRHDIRESRIIAGDAFSHIVTRGIGLSLDPTEHSVFPSDGEVGHIVNHALFSYTEMLETNSATARFMQALALLEFLASPDEYQKFEKVKRVIARYVAKSSAEYDQLLDRFYELTGKKDPQSNQVIGYRTRVVHMGNRIEDVVPNDQDQKRLFVELDSYLRAVIDHMIDHSGMSFEDYVRIRDQLRPNDSSR